MKVNLENGLKLMEVQVWLKQVQWMSQLKGLGVPMVAVLLWCSVYFKWYVIFNVKCIYAL